MYLQVRALIVDYEREPVLRGLNLEADRGEIVAVLGPSGCGKSTLLRTVAGLEAPVSGRIELAGQLLAGIPPHLRGVGLMFQSFALFPHLSVIDNVAFGLEMKQVSKPAARVRGRELLEVVGLAGFDDRDVSSLSGGEQQRVALARSLAPEPRLLMLDEPLGSLDAALRERLTIELRDIFRAVGMTALYVTHDQREALAIADRVAVMREGRVVQTGAPAEIYRAPASEFVSAFLGLGNCVPNSIVRRWLGDSIPDGNGLLLIHPEGISLLAGERELPQSRITDVVYLGDVYRVSLVVDEIMLTVRVPLRDFSAAPPRVGDLVTPHVDPCWITGVQTD